METDGGGWTVFQRRQDGSVDFYRNWTDYENGFGNLTGEFWLGLSKIHRLTKEGSNTLRVDLGDFEGNTRYASYSTFRIADSNDEYRLSIGGYSGTAGDAFIVGHTNHNGRVFQTADRNDYNKCAFGYKAAWWYNLCYQSNLNGRYSDNPNVGHGIVWIDWKGLNYSLKNTTMKVKRQNQ